MKGVKGKQGRDAGMRGVTGEGERGGRLMKAGEEGGKSRGGMGG